MRETWLRPNRRIMATAAVPPLLLGSAGLMVVLFATAPWSRAVGAATTGISAALAAAIALHAALPRLAYRRGQLIVRLEWIKAEAVPIDVVECFLLGQGPTQLPGSRLARLDARTLVVRLAESAGEWAHREVKPALGSWCGGHITVRGAWCEPLGLRLVERLNARLHQVQHAPSPGTAP